MRTFKPRVDAEAPEAPELRATRLDIAEACMQLHLADGRVVNVPYDVTPRLQEATPEQRRNWRFIGPGIGIHWPDIDEDLSVVGLVRDFGAQSA